MWLWWYLQKKLTYFHVILWSFHQFTMYINEKKCFCCCFWLAFGNIMFQKKFINNTNFHDCQRFDTLWSFQIFLFYLHIDFLKNLFLFFFCDSNLLEILSICSRPQIRTEFFPTIKLCSLFTLFFVTKNL